MVQNSFLSDVIMKLLLWSLSFGTVFSTSTAATPTTTAESADAFTTNININVQRECVGVFQRIENCLCNMSQCSSPLFSFFDESIHHATNSHLLQNYGIYSSVRQKPQRSIQPSLRLQFQHLNSFLHHLFTIPLSQAVPRYLQLKRMNPGNFLLVFGGVQHLQPTRSREQLRMKVEVLAFGMCLRIMLLRRRPYLMIQVMLVIISIICTNKVCALFSTLSIG